jgi:hypothetical protein
MAIEPAQYETYTRARVEPTLAVEHESDVKPAAVDLAAVANTDTNDQREAHIDSPGFDSPLPTQRACSRPVSEYQYKESTMSPISPQNDHHVSSKPLPNQPRSESENDTVGTYTTAPSPPALAQAPLDFIDPRYPHLRRRLVPTYRGRTLREDVQEETTRFFDDAAVFVGRLVKEVETEQTLFERFSRYGEIVRSH